MMGIVSDHLTESGNEGMYTPERTPRTVWILWISDTEKPWIEGVYVDKVRAEADMRLLKDTDDGRGYIYWIQEKEVTT